MTFANPARLPDVGTVLAIKTPFGPGEITSRAAKSAKLESVRRSTESAHNLCSFHHGVEQDFRPGCTPLF